MAINNCKPSDINEIFRLYEHARNFQKLKGAVLWPAFEKALIEKEIAESRQWKIQLDNEIACVWATTFNDSQIWEKRNNDPSVYIHRIATNLNFRGQHFVAEIVNWAKRYAQQLEKKFIRMDTVGENKGLIDYYQKNGFDFLGLSTLTNTSELPAHYHNAVVSLFEIKLN